MPYIRKVEKNLGNLINAVPPQNLQAEKAILGAIFLNKDVINDVNTIITVDDFYQEKNKVIYQAMLSLYNQNKVIDIITVPNQLRQDGNLDKIGGLDYINGLSQCTPTIANAVYHANIVHDKAKLRKLIITSSDIMGQAYNENADVEEICAFAEKSIYNATLESKGDSFSSMQEVMLSSMKQLEKYNNTVDGITGIRTGFTLLDRMTSGLQPSDLILIAARPSMGKTAFVLNIAQNIAIREHQPVAFFSLEMSKEQLGLRMLLSESEIPLQKIKDKQVVDTDYDKLLGAGEVIAKAPLYIDDTAGITASELSSKVRKLKTEKGLSLIIIDYLQLMQGRVSKNGDNRQQEISEISRSLKAIARELNVPVIALSQLSRSVESRQIKRPMLSDLRESGSLEQDADIVMFLYRDDYYNEDSETPNVTDIIIAKHRNGEIGELQLYFKKQYTKFVNYLANVPGQNKSQTAVSINNTPLSNSPNLSVPQSVPIGSNVQSTPILQNKDTMINIKENELPVTEGTDDEPENEDDIPTIVDDIPPNETFPF